MGRAWVEWTLGLAHGDRTDRQAAARDFEEIGSPKVGAGRWPRSATRSRRLLGRAAGPGPEWQGPRPARQDDQWWLLPGPWRGPVEDGAAAASRQPGHCVLPHAVVRRGSNSTELAGADAPAAARLQDSQSRAVPLREDRGASRCA